MRLSAFALLTVVATQPANSATTLPIEKGIWSQRPCDRAESIFVYDGRRFGSIWYNSNSSNEPSRSSISGVAGLSKKADGYVSIVFVDSGKERISIKKTGKGSMAQYVSAQFSKPHRLCSFSQLPARIKVAVRSHAPSLADTPPVKMPLPSGGFGIPIGYYINHAQPCWAEHVELFYYDGIRFGWIGPDKFEKYEMRPVAKALEKAGMWQLNNKGVMLQVIDAGRISITGNGWQKWCAINEVRKNARPQKKVARIVKPKLDVI